MVEKWRRYNVINMSKNKTQRNILEGWNMKKMRELYDITSSKRVFQSEWKTQGVPFYRAREIVKLSKEGFVDNELFISNEMYDLYKTKYGVPKENDLLVTGVGTIGILYRVKNNEKFYFKDGNIIWFKNKNFVLSKFIEQLFKTSIIKKQILGSSPITTVATYTIDTAKKTTVYLPPLPEQNQIVAVLETWDGYLEKLSRKIEIKKKVKKGLMQKLLSGRERLKGFSGEWETVKLGDICDYKNGKSFEDKVVKNGKYQLITLNSLDINGNLKNENKTVNVNDNSLNKDDIIMILSDIAHGNFLGMTNIILENNQYVLNQRVGALKPKKIINSIFISKLLNINQKYFKSHGHGSSQQNLSKGDILKFKINLPSLKEQTAIAQILTTADLEIETLEKKKKIIEDQKKYLLNNLITGKILV